MNALEIQWEVQLRWSWLTCLRWEVIASHQRMIHAPINDQPHHCLHLISRLSSIDHYHFHQQPPSRTVIRTTPIIAFNTTTITYLPAKLNPSLRECTMPFPSHFAKWKVHRHCCKDFVVGVNQSMTPLTAPKVSVQQQQSGNGNQERNLKYF